MYRLIVRRVLKTTVAQKQPSCHCYLQDGMLSDTSFQLFTRGRPTLNVRAFQEGADAILFLKLVCILTILV